MTEPTLRDALSRFAPAGEPSSDERDRRRQLADFVRSVEARVWSGPASQLERLRRTLGWDDESLHAFIDTPMIVHSSTHVSMNAFAPMMTFPWFCLRTTEFGRGPRPAVHLRTQVTHNNLSDSRWKPHIWWRVTADHRPTRTRLFSRGPRFEHQILLGQPVPDLPDDLCDSDAEAVDLARHATNFAYFAMVYRMELERRAGLHSPGGTVEVPIDLVNAFSLAGGAARRWQQAMRAMGLALRGVDAENKLYEVAADDVVVDPSDVRSTLICPNYLNVGQAYRLGVSVSIGAEKMSAYLAEMNGVITTFAKRIGETVGVPQFLGVSRFDVDRLALLPEPWWERLGQQGRSSLPLVVAQHGPALPGLLDRALDERVGETADVITLLDQGVGHGG
ncbi:hypothetical protein ACQPZF_25690 [Actinosynnema sp. CS-041913]|uniref:hypothetical protein n=1 Tax=Actinosynnema sp. CS-041913 TaxID=3239917 RepID=UPI003D8B2505